MTTKHQELWSGILFMLIGAAAIWIAKDYKIWEGSLVGSGLFPIGLGGLLVVLGVIQTAKGIATAEREDAGRWIFRPILAITLSIIAFAAIVDRLGMLPALAVAGIIVSFAAKPNFKYLAAVLVVVSAFLYFFLTLFLNLPYRMFIAPL